MDITDNQAEKLTFDDKEKKKVMGLIWNKESKWRLKHDEKRIIMYECSSDGMIINRTALLTPSEAILIALFDGKRTIEDVIKTSADVFEEPLKNSEINIVKLLSKWSMAIEEKEEAAFTPQYNPMDFVIPAWQVDNISKRFFKPLSLQFRGADSCMRKCIYCNIETKPHEGSNFLTIERWRELIKETQELDIHSVIISGGDPFMNPDMMEIIRCFTEFGIHPFISTKSLVTEDEASRLADYGIEIIQVSIDSPIKEMTEFLTGSKGAFEQAVQSIKNLTKAGIEVTTNSVITSYNILSVPHLVHFLRDLAIKKIKLAQYGKSLYADHEDNFFVNEKSGKWLEEQVEEMKAGRDLNINLDFTYRKDPIYSTEEAKKEQYPKRSICSASRWGFVITGDGKVIPCDEIPVTDEYIVGDVSKQSILDVWNSPRNKKYLVPPREPFEGTACYDCEEFDECHQEKGRCFRDALKAYGSIYTPSPICSKAPKGKRLM